MLNNYFNVDFSEIHELDLKRYGLIDTQIENFTGILHCSEEVGSVHRAKEILENAYCHSISAEFTYIDVEHEREWLSENYEASFEATLPIDAKNEIAHLLLKSQAWDNFLAKKFPSVKRYGGEGAESIMAFFRQLFILSVEHEVAEIVLGMPHRGKLNLLTTMLNTPPVKIFHKFKGYPEFPSDANAMCDIANHFRKFVLIV